jgi:hypothetical protein
MLVSKARLLIALIALLGVGCLPGARPAWHLGVSPHALPLMPGERETLVLTVGGTDGEGRRARLRYEGLPPGVRLLDPPATITGPATLGTATYTLTLEASPDAPVGIYTVTLYAEPDRRLQPFDFLVRPAKVTLTLSVEPPLSHRPRLFLFDATYHTYPEGRVFLFVPLMMVVNPCGTDALPRLHLEGDVEQVLRRQDWGDKGAPVALQDGGFPLQSSSVAVTGLTQPVEVVAPQGPSPPVFPLPGDITHKPLHVYEPKFWTGFYEIHYRGSPPTLTASCPDGSRAASFPAQEGEPFLILYWAGGQGFSLYRLARKAG